MENGTMIMDFSDFNLPEIKKNEWNLMNEVRPCLEMLVLVEYKDDLVLVYLDILDEKPFWVTSRGNLIPYKEINKWVPIDDYMNCVEYGERLKEIHARYFEKNSRQL